MGGGEGREKMRREAREELEGKRRKRSKVLHKENNGIMSIPLNAVCWYYQRGGGCSRGD